MDLLHRQVAASGGCGPYGPCGEGMSGGLFTPQSRAGLASYRTFRMANPGLSRAQLSHAWKMHKAGMSGAALVGGFPGQAPKFREAKSRISASHIGTQKQLREALAAEYNRLRDEYKTQHPGYRPVAAPKRGSKTAQKLYSEALRLSKQNPMCPPFPGVDRTRAPEMQALVNRMQSLLTPARPEPAYIPFRQESVQRRTPIEWMPPAPALEFPEGLEELFYPGIEV